jgi:8-oxo-dGTP diphosphatase
MPTPIAIAVVEHEGRFLIGPRPEGVPLAGLWEFPGGKIQPGETPEEAAVRECQEETGLAVTALSRYPEHVQQNDHGQVHLYFIASRPSATTPPAPKPPFRRVSREELASNSFPAGNAQLLQNLSVSPNAADFSGAIPTIRDGP